MAATLEKLTAKTVELPVVLDADDPESTITVWYRPRGINLALAERAVRASSAEDQMESTIDYLLARLVRWDLRASDSDPEPLPVTRETLGLVPVDVLSTIADAIERDQNPNPPTPSGSRGRR